MGVTANKKPVLDLSGINFDDVRKLMLHPIIQEMLEPPIESPSNNLKQVPSRPELQLIPTDLIFERPSRSQ